MPLNNRRKMLKIESLVYYLFMTVPEMLPELTEILSGNLDMQLIERYWFKKIQLQLKSIEASQISCFTCLQILRENFQWGKLESSLKWVQQKGSISRCKCQEITSSKILIKSGARNEKAKGVSMLCLWKIIRYFQFENSLSPMHWKI